MDFIHLNCLPSCLLCNSKPVGLGTLGGKQPAQVTLQVRPLQHSRGCKSGTLQAEGSLEGWDPGTVERLEAEELGKLGTCWVQP